MSEPLARLYDLALRTLDDQERRADALRGRLGPVLAAAALGVSLLGGPFVDGGHAVSLAGTLAILVALGGLAIVLAASTFVLGARRRRVSFDVDPRELMDDLHRAGLLDDLAGFYEAMILQVSRRRARSATALDQLETGFTWLLCGILVMQCGLALAVIVG